MVFLTFFSFLKGIKPLTFCLFCYSNPFEMISKGGVKQWEVKWAFLPHLYLHDRTGSVCTVGASRCPLQGLRKVFWGFVWSNGGCLQCTHFPSCPVSHWTHLILHHKLSNLSQRKLITGSFCSHNKKQSSHLFHPGFLLKNSLQLLVTLYSFLNSASLLYFPFSLVFLYILIILNASSLYVV